MSELAKGLFEPEHCQGSGAPATRLLPGAATESGSAQNMLHTGTAWRQKAREAQGARETVEKAWPLAALTSILKALTGQRHDKQFLLVWRCFKVAGPNPLG